MLPDVLRNFACKVQLRPSWRMFLNTNAFREDLPQYWNFQEMRLLTPSSSTVTIVKAANEVLLKLYRQGYHYKKAGVIVMGIGPNSPIQQDLFDIKC
jgi:DNA polymerase V